MQSQNIHPFTGVAVVRIDLWLNLNLLIVLKGVKNYDLYRTAFEICNYFISFMIAASQVVGIILVSIPEKSGLAVELALCNTNE